jgi:hypothetical protein
MIFPSLELAPFGIGQPVWWKPEYSSDETCYIVMDITEGGCMAG